MALLDNEDTNGEAKVYDERVSFMIPLSCLRQYIQSYLPYDAFRYEEDFEDTDERKE